MIEPGTKPRRDWKALAAQASQENDAKKLMEIIEELCAALDERNGVTTTGSNTKTPPCQDKTTS